MICTKCSLEKPTTEYYRINPKRTMTQCKSCYCFYQRVHFKNLKRRAIQIKGAKCSVCGYSKNMSAMQFHHLDPKQKDYDWHKLRLRDWKTILKELDKCILLCANCHFELHNPNDTQLIPDECNMPTKKLYKCKLCSKETFNEFYCSEKCHCLDRRIVKDRPSNEIVQDQVDKLGFEATARIYGVSGNAIRKWLGLKKKPTHII